MRLDWAGSRAYPLEFLKTRKSILQADVCDVVCSMCNRYANANDSLVAALIDAARRGGPPIGRRRRTRTIAHARARRVRNTSRMSFINPSQCGCSGRGCGEGGSATLTHLV